MPDDDNDEPDEAFIQKFNKVFHKAMTDREKRFEQKIMKSFDGVLGTRFDELRRALSESDEETPDDLETPDATPGQGAGAGVGVSQGQGLSPEIRARLMRTEREAKEAKASAEEYKKQFETEKAQRSRSEERQTLLSVVQPHVKPKLLDIAVSQLHASNLVRDEETNQILWKSEDGTTLPLKDGVAQWAKSDVGKEFAPPVEARGRGSRGPEGGGGAIQPGKMTVEHLGDLVTGSIPGQRHG
jgi:hypothetical protein